MALEAPVTGPWKAGCPALADDQAVHQGGAPLARGAEHQAAASVAAAGH